MGRFGPLLAEFYAPGNLSTPLSAGGVTTKAARAGTAEEHRDAEGNVALIFTNDTDLNALALPGNICWCYKTDSLRPALTKGVTFAEPFIIRSRVAGPAADELTISGPDLLTELRRWTIYRPLGALALTATTLTAEGTGPVARTLAANAAAGTDTIKPNATSEDDFDKEIRITLNNGSTHISIVRSITNDGDDYVLHDRLPGPANSGNALSLRKRLVRVANPAPFQQGVEVAITLNGGTVHNTIAAEGITDGNRVTLRDALPALANSGNAITASDYSGRSTNDVTAIMAYAPGWSESFETGTGTEMGTRYPGGGDTVYDILRSIADETGEIFRLRSAEASPTGPKRVLVWRRTHDSAGDAGLVRLVMPTDDAMATETANKNRAILIEKPRHAGGYDPVTQVIPVAGDSRVTLFGCSAAALADAATAGYSVTTTGLGLYAAPYVKNAALETAIGIYQRKVSFSEVAIEGDNTASISAACDRLLALSIAYLKSHTNTSRDIEAVCVSPIGIRPGQIVELYYQSPTGEYTLDYTGSSPLYVLAVRREVSSGGQYPGVPITTLSLSPTPWRPVSHSSPRPLYAEGRPTYSAPRPPLSGGRTIGREIGRRLRVLEQFAMRNNAPQLVNQAVYVGTGTSSGGGSTTGAYLPLAGGTMTGNISFSGAQTVDGVDVGAHAANPSAHHNPVTAADGSITVSTQAIRIADAAAGDGLGLTAGVLTVKTSTALGTKLVTDVVGVDAWANGGLFNGASGLQVKLPTDSGLLIAAAGLSIGVSTLSATTNNAITGASHTHAITATDNANTTTGALLKGSAVGYLTLAGLGVGDTATSAAAVYAKSKAVDDYTLYLKQLSGQTASILRVEATAGHALIVLTGEGDLESGNPGFVSGMTGWQTESTGNAEFNNVSVRGELHAVTFVADEMHATGGTLAVMMATTVADPVGANDNKLPALGSTFTLNVTASYNTGMPYFATGDIIRVKHMGKVTSGAALDLYDIYLQVQTVGALTGDDLTEGEPGYHPLTCYRRNGGATNLVIPAGAAVVKWGKVSGGAGTYTGGIILTSDMAQSPYIDIFTIDANQTGATWQAAPVTPTPRVRVGNLDGVLGLSEQWGLAAGVDLTDTNVITQRYIVASSAGLQLRNIDLKIYGAASPTVEITNTGDVSFGTDINSDATTTFRHYPLVGAVRLGPLASGKPNVYFDGTDLHLRQHTTPVITLEGSGNSYFAGAMTIGASGGIWQGAGTFASPTTGLKLWNSGGKGVLATYRGGVQQVSLDTDGKLVVGNYGMTLDRDGMTVYPNAAWAGGDAGVRFLTPAGTQFGKLYNYSGTGFYSVLLSTEWSGHTAGLGVGTHATGAHTRAYLYADDTTFILSSSNTVAELNNADLYIKERGLAVGYTATPALNRGQIALDLAGEHDFNAVVLQDTADITHGMTALVDTATYGAIGKFDNDVGGLQVQGFSESVGGIEILGHGAAQSTTKGTGALGGVTVTSRLKSETGAGNHSANGNLLVVRNNTTTRFIIDAEGDFHYDGTGAAYDAYDDPALLATLNREAWGGAIDSEWHRFIDYNRQSLIDAGILSDGGFVNGAALHRLLVGAIGQLATRLNRLEGNYE